MAQAASFSSEVIRQHTMDISMGETGQPPTQETALCEADAFWDDVKPVADEAIEVFKKDCLHEVGEGVKKQGTVVKWLDVTLGCDKEKNLDFGMWLFHQFPPQDDLFYHWGSELPWVENELALGIAAPTVFGILAFAWAKGCSLKPSPGPKTFDALGDQILCDGFVTSGEPLLICQPRIFMGPVPDHYAELQVRMHETWTASGRLMCVHSLGYIKGHARTQILFSILVWSWKNGVDLKVVHPKLWRSCCAIYAHPLMVVSKVDEAMFNMKFSVRGNIRRKNNTIQCVIIVQELFKHGLNDINCFIRKWNGQCAKSDRFDAKKSSAVQLLFGQAPEVVLTGILHHVEEIGWDQAWCSDEVLADKKIYPRFQYPSASKLFAGWLKTSDESMQIMVTRASTLQTRSPVYMRKKLEITDTQNMAERAACLLGIAKQLQTEVPVSDAAINEFWINPWKDGSHQIDMELQCALMDKSDSFQIKQVPTLKRIIDQHVFSQPTTDESTNMNTLKVDEFKFLLKQLNYDVDVYETWQRKCATTAGARYFKEQEHKLEVKTTATVFAKNFVSSCMTFLVRDSEQEMIKLIMDFRRDIIISKLGPGVVPTVPFLNCIAPCQVLAKWQTAQINILSWALHEEITSMSVVLSPQFAYGRAKVHLEEQKLLKELAQGHHNIDTHFTILFKDQHDARDERPMCYTGRLVFPSPAELKQHPFWSCDLRIRRRTSDIPQLSVHAMRMIEDLSPDALPVSTEIRDTFIHGAEKHLQIGTDAYLAVLQGVMTGSKFTEVKAVMFLDLHVKVGELTRAFAFNRSMFDLPTFYVGICECQTDKDWVLADITEAVTEKVIAGQMLLTNGKALQVEMPADKIDPLPQAPATNRLVIKDNKLILPLEIVKEWQFHPLFGKEFVIWMDKFNAKGDQFVVSEQTTTQSQEPPTPNKRRGEDQGDSPSKKLKLDTCLVLETAKVKEPLLQECKLLSAGKDQVWTQLRANHTAVIINKDDKKDFTLSCWDFVSGFGRGSFKLLKGENETPKSQQFEFKLENQDDLVQLNNTTISVGKALACQHESKPDAQICFN